MNFDATLLSMRSLLTHGILLKRSNHRAGRINRMNFTLSMLKLTKLTVRVVK